MSALLYCLVLMYEDINEIYTSSIGGIIRFLDNDDNLLKNKTVIIIVNASGIYKETINNIKRQRFFSQLLKIEQFELLQQLLIRLSCDYWQNSLERLHTKMLFKHHVSSLAPNIIHDSFIFVISQNEKILAFCQRTTILKEYQQVKIHNYQIFVVWYLFTTFENSICQINYFKIQHLKMNITHKMMNSHRNMFVIRDSEDIFSVLEYKDLALIRNLSTKAIIEIDITTRDHVYHVIYNIEGERSNTLKLAKNQIIINNVELWYPNKSYFQISVYLDSTESTQLIISSNTIQIWKYSNYNTIEK
ncbi:9246_t:CDS:2 [Diversispora eburnea]|uniref:9246_t:CDS:1 n=1 Tax=Diversispora eburnea TaxID=1213867 RepID=A0A9N9CL21_9GLOM|nr:9246_t:CDS:2 [Diversispora eburnea]